MPLWIQLVTTLTPSALALIGLVVGFSKIQFRVNANTVDVATLTAVVNAHIANTTIHIDPERDRDRWERLYREIDELRREVHLLRNQQYGQQFHQNSQ